jgi:RNA polymerase sigma-70 factor (ECF subfamily)
MSYAHAAPAGLVPGRDQTKPVRARRQLDPQQLGRHIDRLYRAAWFLCGSPDEAEDLVQDTFARVLLRPRMLHSDDDLGYLLRVLRNTFLTRRRESARRPQTVRLPDTHDLLEDGSAAKPDVRLELVEVYEAVTALPDIFRDVIVAVDVMGLSYREAADALGILEATVTTRLHRARQRLARQLEV